MLPTVDRIAQCIEIVINILSIVANAILLYIIARHTPRRMHTFSVLLLNTAVCDTVISLCAFATNNRIVPAGEAMIFISYGPCKYAGANTCLILHKVLIHALIHGVMSQFIAFSYRYYILVRTKTPTRTLLVQLCVLLYIPSFMLLLIHLTESSSPEILGAMLRHYHPDYDITGLTLSGHVNFKSVSTLMSNMLLIIPNLPLYVVIFFLKRRINNILENKRLRLRRTSRVIHRQLLTVLCLQSYMPLLLLLTMILYLLGQLQIVSHPLIEYMTMTSADLLPLGNSIITIRYITPYWKAFNQLFWLDQKHQSGNHNNNNNQDERRAPRYQQIVQYPLTQSETNSS